MQNYRLMIIGKLLFRLLNLQKNTLELHYFASSF